VALEQAKKAAEAAEAEASRLEDGNRLSNEGSIVVSISAAWMAANSAPATS
jgi:hypothetical protein